MPAKLELEYNPTNGAAVQPWRETKEVDSPEALIKLLSQVGEVIRPELIMSVDDDLRGVWFQCRFAVACSGRSTEEAAPEVTHLSSLIVILGSMGPQLLEQEIRLVTRELGQVSLSATYLEPQD